MSTSPPFDPTPWVSSVVAEPARVQALAALFDRGGEFSRGDVLPPLWHWVALPSWPDAESTGSDGHPRTGGFLPDVGKPRRMFAGGEVELHRPLLVGAEVQRIDRVVSVTPKTGRQGDLVVVEVETELHDEAGQLAVREVQQLIYRDAATPAVPTAPTTPSVVAARLLHDEGGTWRLTTDPTKLVRFSAATSNGHRIHYDHPYATQVEGYPDLVVHGPLMSLALSEVVRRTEPRALSRITHRNIRPLFCGRPAHVESTEDGLVLIGPDGPCVTLDVTFEEGRA